jgi:adenylate cyclase
MAQRSEQSRSPGRLRRAGASAAIAGGRIDRHPRLVLAAKLIRELLPGDSRFGDPLSTAGSKQSQLLGRRLSELTADRPGVLREAGLSALQVWQVLAEAQGRGHGDRELTIVFTDLVDFSAWALEAGDDSVLELLRDVGQAVEPPVKAHGGDVVKRLGDGMMAVFEDPEQGLGAIEDARDRLAALEAPGYRPRMRAGMHVGRPRKLGGDYLGVDVNIAARLADEASADELLVSDRALALLDTGSLKVSKKRFFRVKGVPKDVITYSVTSGPAEP